MSFTASALDCTFTPTISDILIGSEYRAGTLEGFSPPILRGRETQIVANYRYDDFTLRWMICFLTVADVTAPVFNCPTTVPTVFVNDMCLVTDWSSITVEAKDACDLSPTLASSTDTFKGLGKNYYLFETTDPSGNKGSKSCDIEFIDNTAPTLTCSVQNNPLNRNADCSYTVPTEYFPVATDNCDDSVMIGYFPPIQSATREHTVSFTATDDSNNVAIDCPFVVKDPSPTCWESMLEPKEQAQNNLQKWNGQRSHNKDQK
jgi:hypothetical protein